MHIKNSIQVIKDLFRRAFLKTTPIQIHSSSKVIPLILSLPQNETFKALASSNSMLPQIKKGNNLTIKKAPFSQIKVGDIISFYFSKRDYIIVHRVIKISHQSSRKTCITKGDNCSKADSWKVTKNNYLGKITSIKR